MQDNQWSAELVWWKQVPKMGRPWDSKPVLSLTSTLIHQKSIPIPSLRRAFEKKKKNWRVDWRVDFHKMWKKVWVNLTLIPRARRPKCGRQTDKETTSGRNSGISYGYTLTKPQNQVSQLRLSYFSRSMFFLFVPTVPFLQGPGFVLESLPKFV